MWSSTMTCTPEMSPMVSSLRFVQPASPPFSAAGEPLLLCSLPTRPLVQPVSPFCCAARPNVQPASPPFSAAREPAVLCSPHECVARRPSLCAARPLVQPASHLKIHVFELETRPSSPPGPPVLRLVLSNSNTVVLGTLKINK